MVEQHPFKVMVEGSSPSGVTSNILINAGWCKGSTPGFGPGNRGSNPCPAARSDTKRPQALKKPCSACLVLLIIRGFELHTQCSGINLIK